MCFCAPKDRNLMKNGAVQKLRNGQRGEGNDDFVTYRYVYLWGEGGILWNNYVTVDTKFKNSKYPSNIFSEFLKASKGKVWMNFCANDT